VSVLENVIVCFSSARHGRCRNFLLGEIRHAVFRDEIVAGDWIAELVSTAWHLINLSEEGGRLTVSAAHASLAGEGRSAVEYAPVVEDCNTNRASQLLAFLSETKLMERASTYAAFCRA
jgi:hypothetical protein